MSALALLAGFAGVAAASQFRISNVRLHLDAARPVDTIVLTSEDDNDVSFEVHVLRWTQNADGTWSMVPSQDLVVHPLILKMPANGEGRLRVGTISPTVVDEHAYRIELQELPGTSKPTPGQIRMLTKVSIPVFVDPPNAAAQPTLAIDGGTLVLGNTGSAFLAPGQGTLKVLDAKGRKLHVGNLDTNYVLPGAKLPLPQSGVPASACTHAASVELTLPEAKPVVATVAPGRWRCAP